MQKNYTILALGDSYTIGEGIALRHNFAYQTVQLLRNEWNFGAPEIIAETGWTTDELTTALSHYKLADKYDFVTLLIGVNNQYRNRAVAEYKIGFENLLKKAIHCTGEKPAHVLVLSIPDYSAAPYAQMMNREKIEKEIALYNSVNKALSIQYNVVYIDITTGTKEVVTDTSLLADDQLHYSEKEYGRWASKVAIIITKLLNK